MDILNETGTFSSQELKTLKVRFENETCFIQIFRPEANNTINAQLITELSSVLNRCEDIAKLVVLEGTPEIFCFGADFDDLKNQVDVDIEEYKQKQNPEELYDVWLKLSSSSFITIAHVKGKTNAGGVGFVAACDIVLCEERSTFSLSEMLFGLMPACVLPFLIRRIGFSKANYMTLMTQPITAVQAKEWGLVDAYAENSTNLLRKHLLRLSLLNKMSILEYKRYINALNEDLVNSKPKAIDANLKVFADVDNLQRIIRYVKTGKFPWE